MSSIKIFYPKYEPWEENDTGCTWSSALHVAHVLQGDNLLYHRPLLGCREFVFHTRSTSCFPSALISVPTGLLLSHFSFLSPICCCAAVFPSFKSVLREHTQCCSLLSSGSSRWLWEQLELALNWHRAVLGLLTEATPAAYPHSTEEEYLELFKTEIE